ncbi:hypothetical protein Prum_096390 [Phytohabitans rumicis]|uniref:Transcriptional regulator LacI/GalR-like sensor domain-containing protein n=1 Tax=Phytohabitans rumicis TaxID=1076125 RepID=A0A6V8LPH4_9ACTN|nr:hypothetical protein Prum_096390 [Phytohabitans rumicis]
MAYARLGDGDAQPSRDREKGFRKAMPGRLAGPVWTLAAETEVDGLVAEILHGGVTGVVAEQELLAEQILASLQRRGLSVPDDLSVVVLGDSTGARGGEIPWTGLAVPREQMGREATRLLIQQLEDPDAPTRSESVACPLIPGATVASPREPGVSR